MPGWAEIVRYALNPAQPVQIGLGSRQSASAKRNAIEVLAG